MAYENDRQRPVGFTIQTEGQQKLNWDSSLRLLYLIEGEAVLQAGGRTYYLKEQDIFVVNPYEMYSLHGKEPVILCVTLKTSFLNRNLPEKVTEKIECGSCMVRDVSELIPLKKILWKIVQNETERGILSEIRSQILAYTLWEELLEKFADAGDEEKGNSEAGERKRKDEKKAGGEVGYRKMEGILEYINQHYQEELTLQRMSEISFLTRTYFSRMFRKYTGINFSKYLTNLRLSYAVHDVLYTQDEMERIAARHGFSNSRAFSRAFREYYEMLPSEYRRRYCGQGDTQKNEKKSGAVQAEEKYLRKLLAQLGEDRKEDAARPERELRRIQLPEISAGQEGYPLKHNEWVMIHAGAVRRLLTVPVQRQIRETQQALGFAYAQVEGPWDKTLSLFEADQALDFLIDCGFRPWICLGESGDEKMVSFWLRHWRSRYQNIDGWIFETGEERVRECLRREGMTTAGSAFFGTEPAGDISGRPKAETISGRPQTADNLPDILTLRHFPDAGCLEDSENALREQIYDWKKLLKEKGFSKKKQYLTGFRPFWGSKNPLYDSVYYACYLVKNVLENYDRMDAYCLGGISDYAQNPDSGNKFDGDSGMMTSAAENEFDGVSGMMTPAEGNKFDGVSGMMTSAAENEFNGDSGMVTRNGIRKPAFYACRLLRRLGDVLIAKGDGYFVTKSGDSIRMILYHYIHFSPLVLSAASAGLPGDEESCFSDAYGKRMVLRVTDLPYEEYLVTDYYINRRHGSAYDLWKETGEAPVRDEKDADYYNGLSQPFRKTEKVRAEHGGISLVRDFLPQEVRLIELSPTPDGLSEPDCRGMRQKAESIEKGREN